MSEDKSEKLNENERRPVLGDITNRKRGFSLVSSTATSKAGVGNKRPADDSGSENDSQFWKQVALVVDKLEKDNGGRAKCPKISNETGLSPLKGGKKYHLRPSSDGGMSLDSNAQLDHVKVSHVVKNSSNSSLDVTFLDDAERGGFLKKFTISEPCVPSMTVAGSSKDCQVNRVWAEKGSEGGETRVLVDDIRQPLVDKAGCLRLTEPQDIGSFGMERCTRVNDDSCSILYADYDVLKSCSCSFCTKVAYIWSDLHYQDVKDHISELTKSHKEASNLAQRYSGENEVSKHGQENSSKGTHMEAQLSHLWTSLFQNMENIYGSECSELQNKFHALKKIRDDCKTNLDMINAVPSDIQPHSSNASDQL